jgi:endoglucanase
MRRKRAIWPALCAVILSLSGDFGRAAGEESPSTQAAPAFALDFARLRNLPHELRIVPEGPNGENCLLVAVGEKSKGDWHMVDLPFDLSPFRDHEILLSYDYRTEGVTEPEGPHGGIKVQLHWKSIMQGERWLNVEHRTGTNDWQRVESLIRVDGDAAEGRLQLGLQGSRGKLWLANIKISILRARPQHVAEAFRGHDLPRLRGLVGSGIFRAEDLGEMRKWGANVVRWRLLNPRWPRTEIPSDRAIYEAWLAQELDELQKALDRARELDMKVLVDLHSPPGGRLSDGTLRMVLDRSLGEFFIEIWTRIARRFRDHPGLWAYDIMNEPVQKRPSPPGVLDWWALQEAAAQAVRREDPQKPILIAVDDWDAPAAFAWMRAVDVPRVIYTVHVYWPYEYTHQGLEGEWSAETALTYPGTFQGQVLDKAAVARQLEPVREFQRVYNVQIFVGEFSVVRYAPGAAQYLQDCLELFEEYGWDWTYHAFRESTEWDLEHADLPRETAFRTPPDAPSPRQAAIRRWLAKNSHANLAK